MPAHVTNKRLTEIGILLDPARRRPPADAFGYCYPGAVEAGKVKAKTEAAVNDVWNEADAQEATFTPQAKKDVTNEKAIKVYAADEEAARQGEAAIEAGREAAADQGDERAADGAASALVALVEIVRPALVEQALGTRVAASARNLNPKDRLNPLAGLRLAGGTLIDQLEAAIRSVGIPDYVVLAGPEHALWHSGEREGRVDVFGDPVPSNMPPGRVRRSYTPGTRVLHPVDVQGGVA